jgi:hypothetical protein
VYVTWQLSAATAQDPLPLNVPVPLLVNVTVPDGPAPPLIVAVHGVACPT